jgi:DNA-binding NarL/FixJ family response regulator
MNLENNIRIIIADTQFLTTNALENTLKDVCSILETVGTKIDLLGSLAINPASLVIMDCMLIDLDSIADIKEILQRYPRASILILTNSLNQAEFSELTDAGIKNILLKTTDQKDLLQAIDATLQGKKYYSEEILDLIIEKKNKKENQAQILHLTTAEMEIVKLIAEGLTTKEIAVRKFISFHTVMTHRKNIFRKLGVNSISELIMYAIKAGWIDNIEYYI